MKAGACHILVKTEKEAQQLKAQLDKGANFQQLAKKHSLCPSGKKGGDLGEFSPGTMVKAFDNVVFKKEISRTSQNSVWLPLNQNPLSRLINQLQRARHGLQPI